MRFQAHYVRQGEVVSLGFPVTVEAPDWSMAANLRLAGIPERDRTPGDRIIVVGGAGAAVLTLSGPTDWTLR